MSEMKERVVAARQDGHTWDTIGAFFGMSPQQARQLAAEPEHATLADGTVLRELSLRKLLTGTWDAERNEFSAPTSTPS